MFGFGKKSKKSIFDYSIEDIIERLNSQSVKTARSIETKLLDDLKKQYFWMNTFKILSDNADRELAFLDAIKALIDTLRSGNFDNTQELGGYFFKIFKYKCVDIYKKSQKNKAVSNYLSDSPDEIQKQLKGLSPVSQDIILELREDVNIVIKAIQQLGETCQKLLFADALDNLSITEISQKFKLTPRSVSTQLSRCRKKLKDIPNVKKIYNFK